jgi:serine/threonine protein kinase
LPCRVFADEVRDASREESSGADERNSTAPRADGRRARSSGRSSRSRDSRRRSADAPVPVGAVIDKYRLEEVLGKGAFAVVYRATHLLLRTPVAIKMLLPKVVEGNPRLAAMLCEEARLAARVDHPNVVRVRDVSKSESLSYIVMDFVDGEALSRVIARERRLSPERVLAIGTDCCAGLASAQQGGVIHRDVKPSNILLTPNGTSKIIDLGLARCVVEAPSRGAGGSHLPSDAIVGTPAYMSPEQVERPEQVDFRTDIYSLGATLYHAACGQPAYSAHSVEELRRQFSEVVVAPLDARVVGFPSALSQIIARMMSKSRSNRPQDYAELQHELRSTSAASESAAISRPSSRESALP